MIKHISIIILISSLITSVYAQDSLYIKSKNGNYTSINLSKIKKITFPADNAFLVEFKDSTTSSSFVITDTKRLTFNSLATAIEESDLSLLHLNIYPNPVSDILYLNNTNQLAANVEINIVDSFGQTVYNQIYTNKIDVSSFPIGMYLINIKSNNSILSQKLIKN